MFNWFKKVTKIDLVRIENQWDSVVSILEDRVSVLEKEVKVLTEREVINLIALAVLERRLKSCVAPPAPPAPPVEQQNIKKNENE
jgi:hypothetical protein